MKNLFFTVILLLVLGTAWMLYLEYNNRRFIENLSPPPAPMSQSVPTTAAPVLSESDETAVPAEATLDTTGVESFTEHDHIHPHPSPDLESLTPTETSEHLFESLIFEEVIDEGPEHSIEAVPSENGVLADPGEDTELQRVLDTLTRIEMNPDNWIEGSPGSDNGTVVVPIQHGDAFFEAMRTLSERPVPQRLLSNPEFPAAPRTRTGTRRVKFWGGEIEIPTYR